MKKLILVFFALFVSGLWSDEKTVNNAIVPMPKLENDFYDWYKRHDAVKELIKKKSPDLIFLGDSITHMFGGEPKSKICRGLVTWDKYYASRNAINMGFGWDRTQNVLWRIADGCMDEILPKVAVVMIGTNNIRGSSNARANTPTEIAEAIELICEKIHEKLPSTKILLLSMLPRSYRKKPVDFFVKPILEINQKISQLDEKSYITYFDLYSKFNNGKNLVTFPDGALDKMS
jgi:lysophospholipase L1-like esterase